LCRFLLQLLPVCKSGWQIWIADSKSSVGVRSFWRQKADIRGFWAGCSKTAEIIPSSTAPGRVPLRGAGSVLEKKTLDCIKGRHATKPSLNSCSWHSTRWCCPNGLCRLRHQADCQRNKHSPRQFQSRWYNIGFRFEDLAQCR